MFRFFEDLADPFQPYIHQKPSSDVWTFLREHLRPLRHVMALSVLFTLFSVAIELGLIGYTGRLLNLLSQTPQNRFWEELGPQLAVIAIGLLILRPLVAFIRESLDDLAFRPNAVSLIRWRSHRHLLRQPVGWFRNEPSGRLGSRVREVGISAAGAAYSVLHTLIYVVAYLLGSVWLMGSADPRLALPLLFWLLLYLAHMAYVVPRFRDNHERFNAALTNLSSLFVDTYSNIETIKLFADQDLEDVESKQAFRAARSKFLRVQRFEVLTNVGMIALGTMLLVSLVGYSVVLWQSGDAPIGIVAASLALALRVNGMAEWMLDSLTNLFRWIGATRDALQSIAQPLLIEDAPDAGTLELRGGAIRFQGVSHHYGRECGGLEALSLDIRAGEKIGLVGPSGGGKSTLINLLMRHFDPEKGQILIDGQDIRTVKQESLRRHIAVVSQDPSLLNRSVADNIAYGRDHLSRAAIKNAARRAHADAFIKGLRDPEGKTGYEASVGERGVQLSGGQRQRIALARALLKDAQILILDEATSALDSESEAAILDTLYPMMGGRTVVAIAHRLSTISHMDRIAVLDQGHIIESGTHDQLLARQGHYTRLWARQSEGFIQ